MQQPIKSRFRHRDLNWLSFNERVLQEAEDKRNPLYDRIRFLAIFSSNLDEYFRVRVSQLRQIKRVKKSLRRNLALRPSKIIKEILEIVKLQQGKFGQLYYDEIIPELAQNGIFLIEAEDFSRNQQGIASSIFEERVKKHLEPVLIDTRKENKIFLENSLLYLLVAFSDDNLLGVLNVPVDECGRFLVLENQNDKYCITLLDEIIRAKVQDIFKEKKISGVYEVKLSRDAELYIDDEYDGILAEKIYESLSQRMQGQPTRLLYDAQMPKEIRKKIRKLLGLGKIDMMPGGKYHNFKDFFSFPDPLENPELHSDETPPIVHKDFKNNSNYFEVISEKDRSLHFPYMSFKHVEEFLEQAVNDKNVEEIKISLYRIADESSFTSNLLKALENGKKLTVFVEAKARFDEANNIIWGRKFEEKGARVIYSYPKIKVHSKIMLIKRIENKKEVGYAYIGTGNFNSETSKIYCDHAIFTADRKITNELCRIFMVLEGELIIPREKKLLVSPFSTRQQFTSLIYREIENAQAGKKAKITAKMNSLEDKEIIELLYKASRAGVNIRLLIRGFTCLVPGVKGLSENIFITSIVDRYLEHGRIFLFEHSGEEKIFFGSADWMTRNLDNRIEVIAPVTDKEIAREFRDILEIQLQDNMKARIQDASESNEYVKRNPEEKPVRSQVEIYNYLKQKHEI